MPVQKHFAGAIAISTITLLLVAIPSLAVTQSKSQTSQENHGTTKPTPSLPVAGSAAHNTFDLDSFKTQLSQVKDQKKQQVLLRLQTQIASVSGKQADMLSYDMQKLTTVYDKLASKEAAFEEQNCDTQKSAESLLAAQQALTAAQESVSSQSAAQYIIDVSDPLQVKASVGATVKQLETDLHASRQSLISAKTALKKSAKLLRTCTKLSGTPSAAPSEPEEGGDNGVPSPSGTEE